MSVIAWDGKILAADRQGMVGDTLLTRTKLVTINDNCVIGWVGDTEKGVVLRRWVEHGEDPAQWPEFQRTSENWCRLIVLDRMGVYEYEQEPARMYLEDERFAWGSGAAYALGAMAAGADAIGAVLAASQCCGSCGRGVDAYSFDDERRLVKLTM